MRSVSTKTLLSSLMILALSFLIFGFIVRASAHTWFKAGGAFGGLLDDQSLEAERQYTAGGRDALLRYLQHLERVYPQTQRSLLDMTHHDVLTGVDRSRDFVAADSLSNILNLFGPHFVQQATPNRKFILLLEVPSTAVVINLVNYYLLLAVAIAVLCFTFRRQFVLPLNQLTSVVRRFGAGDLTARAGSNRRDELGELGLAFDDMAQRIETLLTAERRLLQDISHELRSPLARLSFAIELARNSNDRQTAFAHVNEEIERITELIQNLLQVTRAEGDSGKRNVQNVAMDELLTEIIDYSEIEARPRGCRLSLNVWKKLNVYADRELLRRAIENIVRNAIRHAPEGSQIEIELTTSSTGVFISVRDQGRGVPEEELEAIFKPFYRVDDSRAEATGGVGLGLAIAQRAIRVHHGNVWAENGNPGLRVCIELPSERRSLAAV